MLFNSIDFAIFLPIVFTIYWIINGKSKTLQNLFILTSSYIFYGWWDWRFLSLILFSTIVDYFVGLRIYVQKNTYKRKLLLAFSIFVNIGLLWVFKYFNFFLNTFIESISFFGAHFDPISLHIVLPVGISFYTFQTLSYSIDIYKKEISPTKDFVAFAAFVSFFPQLVAGPIERASHLLPQFFIHKHFEYNNAANGMRQILWGLFKKIVVADNCAQYVNIIFSDYSKYNSSTLALGAFLFAFQIYGDFSGYSDIAIGVSRLFDFELIRNFNFPYFSRDIAEFWRRWHISLSTWFRDYLYIPLGGSRGDNWHNIRNIFIIFAVSGFWHGASWNFIIWGVLNAVYFLPLLVLNKNRKNLDTVAQGKLLPNIYETIQMAVTFLLCTIGWIFFRSESLTDAIKYIEGIFSNTILSFPQILPKFTILFIIILMTVEWVGRERQFAIENLNNRLKLPVRYAFYYAITIAVVFCGGNQQDFIYFQF